MAYTDAHRAFARFLLAKGCATQAEAQQVWVWNPCQKIFNHFQPVLLNAKIQEKAKEAFEVKSDETVDKVCEKITDRFRRSMTNLQVSSVL